MSIALVCWTLGYVGGVVLGDAVGVSERTAQSLTLMALPLMALATNALAPFRLSWATTLPLLALPLGLWAQARPTASLDPAILLTAYARPQGASRSPHAQTAPTDNLWICEGIITSQVVTTHGGSTFRLSVSRLRSLPRAQGLSDADEATSQPWMAAEPTLDVRLLLDGAPAEPLWPGDRVRVLATLRPLTGHRNPGIPQAGHDGLSLHGAAFAHGDALLRIHRVLDWRCWLRSDRGPKLFLWRLAGRTRAALLQAVQSTIATLPPWAAGAEANAGSALLVALTLGDRAPLRRIDSEREARGLPRIEQSLKGAGVYHILSVSGLHLAVICLGFFRLASGLLRRWQAVHPALATHWVANRLAALITLPVCVAYALVSGAEPPAVRAAVATVMWLVANACGQRARLAEGLAVAILWSALPIGRDASAHALFDPSLVLSFAATLAIAYLQPLGAGPRSWTQRDPAARSLQRARTWALRLLWRLVDSSLAASLGTLPLIAYYFAEVQGAAVIGNLLVTPLAELVVLPLGLLAELLAWLWPPLGTVPALGAIGAAHLMCWLAQQVTQLGLSMPVASPCLLLGAVWYAGLLMWRGYRRVAWLLLGSSLLVYAVLWLLPSGKLHVTFLDIGQGDAAVVELPRGGVIVVDAGWRQPDHRPGSDPAAPSSLTSHDSAQAVLVPFLRHRGHRRIDLLIASHRHPDHIGGMATLLEQFPVGALWLTPQPRGLSTDRDATALAIAEQRLIERAQRNGTRVTAPHPGTFQGVELAVLGPCLAPPGAAEPAPLPQDPRGCQSMAQAGWHENDNSLVLRLRFAGRTVLFTGDIEQTAERELLARHPPAALTADVLKVAHHCSRTSSSDAWLAAVKPRWAICSLGLRNRFGFPHTDVVQRLASRHVPLLRTDQLGAVSVAIDDTGQLTVTTQAAAPPWQAWLPFR